MLDLFTVFTKSGLVLWCFQDPQVRLDGDPVNELIKQVLIEQRGGATGEPFLHASHALEYRLDNVRDIVFAAVYQKSLQGQLDHISQMIGDLKERFIDMHGDAVKDNPFQPLDFKAEFEMIRKAVEDESRKKKMAGGTKKVMRDFKQTKKAKVTKQYNEDLQAGKQPQAEFKGAADEIEADVEETSDDRISAKLKALKMRKNGGGGRSSPTKKKSGKSSGKGGSRGGSESDEPQQLDYSVGSPSSERLAETITLEDGRDIEDYDSGAAAPKSSGSSSGMFSYFSSLTGGGNITSQMLEPVLDKMRQHLIGKNVAADIAEKICESVGQGLEGKSKGTFEAISTVVQDSLSASLTNILTPKRRVDILRDVMAAKSKKQPYSIVFCGVNGVGKSTNLAKICFWLLQNGNRVCIAACDTFRAGAVEQLKTHMNKLNHAQKAAGIDANVQLYDQGYGKDPANIAAGAIQYAASEGYDVVLVDTAGRMQDNAPLMRALTKLVSMNDPNLILFVGEALVGNEAVDQLSKFNKSLADYSDKVNPRLIDGIVLSKFDTIDDKVGAAISMTYTTGQPIVFVGTGQSYADLKKLNVKSVVNALLT